MNHIELLYDLFYKYDDYQDIRDELRSHVGAGNITEEQYDELMDGYDYFLDEYLQNEDIIHLSILNQLTPEVKEYFKSLIEQHNNNDLPILLKNIGKWIYEEIHKGEK
jgi:hypothetical protein